ncbi:MAG: hypothetical protein LDL23_09005 [Flavobacterium sp.]|uniref:hypothetical protein n=1 Tax=Flavobacterium sp. TaxID=239 RepID=UPI0025BE96D6|nr:hypothetical protein [Flavobacterium sp.]MCA1966775.1 hypothetical protein [Flavobacterium sp.]
MSKVSVLDKINDFITKRKYCKISRIVNKEELSCKTGYIIDSSNDFILFKEVDDFFVRGFLVFPINQVSKIRRNKKDVFFDKICRLEGIKDSIKKPDIELKNWESIFNSIQRLGFNVVIINEISDEDTFEIGPILKVTKNKVNIKYFDATGKFEEGLTEIKFSNITHIDFDDIYTNTISKYLKIK